MNDEQYTTRNTLSYTTAKLLKECPRKYYLTHVNHYHEEQNVHFSFGRAVGGGITTALLEDNLEAGYLALLQNYHPYLSTERKNLWSACRALQALWTFWHENEYHLRYQPLATEHTFLIKDVLPNSHYVGHIDLILRDRETDITVVLDVKTTQWNLKDFTPLWQNSPQVILYGAAMQAHQYVESQWSFAPLGFDRIYFVAQLQRDGSVQPHFYTYPTQARDIKEACATMVHDFNQLTFYSSVNDWPMYGDSCFSYSRSCPLLNECSTATALDWKTPEGALLPREFSETEIDFCVSFEQVHELLRTS